MFAGLLVTAGSMALLFLGCTGKTETGEVDSFPLVAAETNRVGELIVVARNDHAAGSSDVYLFAFKQEGDAQLFSQSSDTTFTSLSLDADKGELVLATDRGVHHVLSVGHGDRSEEVIEGHGLAKYPGMSTGDPQKSLNQLVESGLRLMLPERLECQSGGPGAWGCSISSLTSSCEVWCADGNETAYACCRPRMQHCGCVNSAD